MNNKIEITSGKWKFAVIFISLIPLLPEYLAPVLAILSFILTYSDCKNKQKAIRIGVTGRIIIVFILYSAAGLIYTANFMSTLQTVLLYLTMFLVYLSVFNIITGRRKLDFIFLGVSFSAGIAGIIAFFQYIAYVLFSNRSTYIWDFADKLVYNYLPFKVMLETPNGRMSSTFNNPNIFAEFMIMAFPFAVYYSFIGIDNIFRRISVFSIFSIAFGIAFSFSRSGYVALIFIMLFYGISKIRKYTMVITGILSTIMICQRPVIERFFSIPAIDTSTEKRFDIWRQGVRIIMKNPVFGNGAGVENIWNLLNRNGINTPHMHNIVIQILSEGGIVGLIIFSAIIWQIMKTSIILIQEDSYAHIVGISLIAFLTGFLAAGIADFPLMTPKLISIFFLAAGVTDGASNVYINRQPVGAFEKHHAGWPPR